MRKCKYCEKELENNQKSYCSRACRNKDNPKHRKEVPSISKVCPICETEFLATRKDRIYCSQSCNDKAKKQRRKERPQPGQTHWRKKRHEVFEQQSGKCWLCGNKMDGHRFDVHHLENDHDLFSDNLAALHKECHSMMHKITVVVTSTGLKFEGEALNLLKEKGYANYEL